MQVLPSSVHDGQLFCLSSVELNWGTGRVNYCIPTCSLPTRPLNQKSIHLNLHDRIIQVILILYAVLLSLIALKRSPSITFHYLSNAVIHPDVCSYRDAIQLYWSSFPRHVSYCIITTVVTQHNLHLLYFYLCTVRYNFAFKVIPQI